MMRASVRAWAVAGAVAGSVSATTSPAVNAAAAGSAIGLAPHRAVYEITLERAASGSGVVELAGRMVYELSGSRCEGYTQNMRFVTQVVSQDGTEQVNDLRTSSWEDGDGMRLRFNSEQYRDAKLVEATTGDARRASVAGQIEVDVSRPEKKRLDIAAANLFPMQHSTALLAAAGKGQKQLVSGLYDGSDKGEKVYQTSAWIGGRITPVKTPGLLAGLERLPSWPVAIAYFEPGSEARDAVPAYELSFRIFDNGVSSEMLIDYGDFAVRGELKELTFMTRTECSSGASGVAPNASGKKATQR